MCKFPHTATLQGGEKQGKVTKLSKAEVLMLNIGSMCTGAKVLAVRFPLSLRSLLSALLDSPFMISQLHYTCEEECAAS